MNAQLRAVSIGSVIGLVMILGLLGAFYLGYSSRPKANQVTEWVVKDFTHANSATVSSGDLPGMTGLQGEGQFTLYTFRLRSELAGTSVTLTDHTGQMIGQFKLTTPPTMTLVKFEIPAQK